MAKALEQIPCPGCTELGLQRLIYGMPDEDFDFEKYLVGGCVIGEFNIGCGKCGWAGIHKDLKELHG